MEENAVVGPPSHKRRRSSESGNAVASLSLSSVSKKIKIKLKRIEFSEDDPFSDVKEENLPKNAYELLGVLSEESNSEDNGVSSTSEIKKEEDGSNKKDKFPDFNADDHNASIPVGYELYATSKYDRKWRMTAENIFCFLSSVSLMIHSFRSMSYIREQK